MKRAETRARPTKPKGRRNRHRPQPGEKRASAAKNFLRKFFVFCRRGRRIAKRRTPPRAMNKTIESCARASGPAMKSPTRLEKTAFGRNLGDRIGNSPGRLESQRFQLMATGICVDDWADQNRWLDRKHEHGFIDGDGGLVALNGRHSSQRANSSREVDAKGISFTVSFFMGASLRHRVQRMSGKVHKSQ